MCVWVNMIVRPGVVIKSLMNTRTSRKPRRGNRVRGFLFYYSKKLTSKRYFLVPIDCQEP